MNQNQLPGKSGFTSKPSTTVATAKHLNLTIFHLQKTAFATAATVIATANQRRRCKLPTAFATAINGAVGNRCNGYQHTKNNRYTSICNGEATEHSIVVKVATTMAIIKGALV